MFPRASLRGWPLQVGLIIGLLASPVVGVPSAWGIKPAKWVSRALQTMGRSLRLFKRDHPLVSAARDLRDIRSYPEGLVALSNILKKTPPLSPEDGARALKAYRVNALKLFQGMSKSHEPLGQDAVGALEQVTGGWKYRLSSSAGMGDRGFLELVSAGVQAWDAKHGGDDHRPALDAYYSEAEKPLLSQSTAILQGLERHRQALVTRELQGRGSDRVAAEVLDTVEQLYTDYSADSPAEFRSERH